MLVPDCQYWEGHELAHQTDRQSVLSGPAVAALVLVVADQQFWLAHWRWYSVQLSLTVPVHPAPQITVLMASPILLCQ